MLRTVGLALACVLAGALAGSGATAAAPQGAAGLGWLSGCWATPGAEAGSGETWTAPAGGTLLGLSRTVKGGRTVAWEFLLIQDEPDGTYLVARPSGQPEAKFRAVAFTPGKVVFENPAHDFPQRVIYERRSESAMVGRIEGTANGRARAVDFPLERVACRD